MILNLASKIYPTMIDQKSIDACTLLKPGDKGVDSQRCYLCGKRSSGDNSFQNSFSAAEPSFF